MVGTTWLATATRSLGAWGPTARSAMSDTPSCCQKLRTCLRRPQGGSPGSCPATSPAPRTCSDRAFTTPMTQTRVGSVGGLRWQTFERPVNGRTRAGPTSSRSRLGSFFPHTSGLYEATRSGPGTATLGSRPTHSRPGSMDCSKGRSALSEGTATPRSSPASTSYATTAVAPTSLSPMASPWRNGSELSTSIARPLIRKPKVESTPLRRRGRRRPAGSRRHGDYRSLPNIHERTRSACSDRTCRSRPPLANPADLSPPEPEVP